MAAGAHGWISQILLCFPIQCSEVCVATQVKLADFYSDSFSVSVYVWVSVDQSQIDPLLLQLADFFGGFFSVSVYVWAWLQREQSQIDPLLP